MICPELHRKNGCHGRFFAVQKLKKYKGKMDNIQIIRSARRTISVEIRNDLSVVVRAPAKMSEAEINRFIKSKSSWIEKHIELQKSSGGAPVLTDAEIKELKHTAAGDISERVKQFAEAADLTYGRVTIRCQRTRWGSCSSSGNLSFNCLLMLCPESVRDYVVVHELCHLIQLNHSSAFWAQVGLMLPDYEDSRRFLREEGRSIIARIPN